MQHINNEMMRYAQHWARRYCGSSRVTYEDLRGEAYLGLCLAANSYDESRGATFKTYATYYIKRQLCSALRRYTSESETYAEETHLEPSKAAYAEQVKREEQREQVELLLQRLTPRERHAVELHYGLGGREISVKEAAKEMKVSEKTIHRLLKRAIGKMKI